MPEFDPSSLSVDDADLAVLINGAYCGLEIPFLILKLFLIWRLLVGWPQDFLLVDVLANNDNLENKVKVSPNHGLNEIPLIEEAFDILLEVFRVLILGWKQILEDAVLRDLNRAELLVELGIARLDTKVPL